MTPLFNELSTLLINKHQLLWNSISYQLFFFLKGSQYFDGEDGAPFELLLSDDHDWSQEMLE
jgi:hypothetical protein